MLTSLRTCGPGLLRLSIRPRGPLLKGSSAASFRWIGEALGTKNVDEATEKSMKDALEPAQKAGTTRPLEKKEYSKPPLTRYDAIGILSELIANHPVVVFMKGIPNEPRCGHSAKMTRAIASTGLEHYVVVDVMQSDVIRSTLKELAGCKTVPQLFVKGEFVGDAEKVEAMAANGELADVLGRYGTHS